MTTDPTPDIATAPHPAADPDPDQALLVPLTPAQPPPSKPPEEPDPATGLIDPRRNRQGPDALEPSGATDETVLEVTELPELEG